MEANKDCLEVQMFGGFSMTYQGKKIEVGKSYTSRAFQLLLILLYSGTEGISRFKLLENLFGRDNEGDVANNLRVTVYNLRKILRESGLPLEDYIHTEKKNYRFVSSFPVKVDAAEFVELIAKATDKPEEERLMLLKKAFTLYQGDFLPELFGEEWIVIEEAYFQHQFFDCMEEICKLMIKRQEYEELLVLCGKAVALYPFAEWQLWQMECLKELGRYKEAVELYEKTTAMYFDELAASPSERMMEYFQRLSSQVQPDTANIHKIQEVLKEKEYPSGAYYCAYPSFVDSYHIMARVMERSGQSIYLMLCTIYDSKDSKRQTLNLDRLKQTAFRLSEAIRETLRQGDFFTQYNKRQFLVVMIGIRKEDCSVVINRIDACFRKKESSRQVEVTYRTMSIADLQMWEDGTSFT